MDARRVQGGWLFQDWDVGAEMGWEIASERAPTEQEARALDFAWKACRNVKSNAIVLAKSDDQGALLNGVGAGQMSRVDSVKIAVSKATSRGVWLRACLLMRFFHFLMESRLLQRRV